MTIAWARPSVIVGSANKDGARLVVDQAPFRAFTHEYIGGDEVSVFEFFLAQDRCDIAI